MTYIKNYRQLRYFAEHLDLDVPWYWGNHRVANAVADRILSMPVKRFCSRTILDLRP